MPGKLCTGQVDNNAYNARTSKSFCEGLDYRASGTAVSHPVSANPHETGSEDAQAWGRGWGVANNAAGGKIPQSLAPCCAVTSLTIQL